MESDRTRDRERKAANKECIIKQVCHCAQREHNSLGELCKPMENAWLEVIPPKRKQTRICRYQLPSILSWELPGSINSLVLGASHACGLSGVQDPGKTQMLTIQVCWSTLNWWGMSRREGQGSSLLHRMELSERGEKMEWGWFPGSQVSHELIMQNGSLPYVG